MTTPVPQGLPPPIPRKVKSSPLGTKILADLKPRAIKSVEVIDIEQRQEPNEGIPSSNPCFKTLVQPGVVTHL